MQFINLRVITYIKSTSLLFSVSISGIEHVFRFLCGKVKFCDVFDVAPHSGSRTTWLPARRCQESSVCPICHEKLHTTNTFRLSRRDSAIGSKCFILSDLWFAGLRNTIEILHQVSNLGLFRGFQVQTFKINPFLLWKYAQNQWKPQIQKSLNIFLANSLVWGRKWKGDRLVYIIVQNLLRGVVTFLVSACIKYWPFCPTQRVASRYFPDFCTVTKWMTSCDGIQTQPEL